MQWLVLMYSLRAAQARRCAILCRELKMIGAVDLRDDVCVLPETPATRQVRQSFATQIRAYQGTDGAARASVVIAECESTIRDLPCAVVAT